MDLIEKATKKMAEEEKSSLIERAAWRLSGQQAEEAPASPVEPSPPAASETAPPAPPAEAPPDAVAPELKPVRRVFIDLDRLYVEGLVTPRGERTRIAEEFRMIKRPLLLNALAKDARGVENGNLIMVSSAVPQSLSEILT